MPQACRFKSCPGHHQYDICGGPQEITPNRGIFSVLKQLQFNTIHIGASAFVRLVEGECN